MIRHWFRTLISYLKSPSAVLAAREMNELQEEIEFHLTSSVRDNVAAGLGEPESRQAARQRFGDVGRVVRNCCEDSLSHHVFLHRIHLAVTLLLMGAVGFLWYRSASPAAANPNSSASAASGYSLAETSGDIEGSVTDHRGQPVTSAHVLAVVKTWPPNGYRQQSYMARTRPDGTFAIENVYPLEHEYEIQISVVSDGHPLQSEYVPMTTGTLIPLQFRLQETSAFAMRFESDDGQPLTGVSAFPFERVDRSGERHSVYFCSADPIVRKSGTNGSVPMPHFLPGEEASVFVRFPDRDWEIRKLVVPPKGKSVVVLKPTAPADPGGG